MQNSRKSRAIRGNWSNESKPNPYAGFEMVGATNDPSSIRSNATTSESLAIPGTTRENGFLAVPGANGGGSNSNGHKQASRKVSRRFSVHMQHPQQFDAANLPPVPILDSAPYGHNGDVMMRVPAGVSGVSDNEDPLASSGFNVKNFIMTELRDAPATKIDDFNKTLAGLDKSINNQIKVNINNNHAEILSLNKNLIETENELKVLRTSTNELYEIIDQMRQAAQRRLELENHGVEASAVASSNKAARDRSSIIVLEKMWANELNSLFKHVEGAQKFLAPVPGRHVVAESGRWFELNVATWKALKPAHLFLLNDMLLIAQKKKRSKETEDYKTQKLVAAQCWPLREVEITDVSNKEEKMYTINVKFNSLSYLYRTDRYDHYNKIMKSYKKAKEDLMKMANQEIEEERKKLRSSRSSLRNSIDLQEVSAKIHSRNRSADLANGNGNGSANANGSSKNGSLFNELKQIDDQINELDIAISHHKFAESVRLIQSCERKLNAKISDSKHRKSDAEEETAILMEVLRLKLEQHKDLLEKNLVFELNNPFTHTTPEQIVTYLKDLGLAKTSRELYLESVSNEISKLRRTIIFQGDIPSYITQISIITFQKVKKAILTYKECFPDVEASSTITTWCCDEVKSFAKLLENQLYDAKVNSPSYVGCVNTVRRQADELRQCGMNVNFLLESFFRAAEAD